jgi:hypothetical protein
MVAERLTGARLVGVLALPWLFLVVFTYMFTVFLWPKIASGSALAIIIGLFILSVYAAAIAAAFTFTRDVVTGRYPGEV